MLNKEAILLEHLVTEKATEAASHANQYTFRVAKSANRVAIKAAIESQFGVEVRNLQVLNVKPKVKSDRSRRGRGGRKPGFKKAIIRLKDGQSIDLV